MTKEDWGERFNETDFSHNFYRGETDMTMVRDFIEKEIEKAEKRGAIEFLKRIKKDALDDGHYLYIKIEEQIKQLQL